MSAYCGDGLKFIISSFTILTIAITTTLILQLVYTDDSPQKKASVHGAVASDYTNCSQIGTKILRKGGNAIDAAVAATVCMTVVAPHKTGLGGGGYIMIYNHKEQSDPIIIDFANNTVEGIFAKNGIRAPAVLKGLEYAHTLKGNLPWSEVIEPSVALAKQGFVVSKEFASEVSKNTDNESLYGHLNAGDILKLNELADTLEAVARHGANVLYNGSLSRDVFHDETNVLEEAEQLANYEPLVYAAKELTFYGHKVYYPLHSTIIQSMIVTLAKLQISTDNASTIETQVRVAEALIHSITIPLQKKQNVAEERYTGIVAMDWEDTYVCIITGLSVPFGLGYMNNAGFLLDKVDNDNTLTMFTPIIFHNEKSVCGLRGLFATDDVFLIGQLLYNIIVRGLNVSAAIEYPRYYVLSDGLATESDPKHSVDILIRNELNSMISVSQTDANLILKSVNAIIKRKDLMSSHSDSRGGGLSSRY